MRLVQCHFGGLGTSDPRLGSLEREEKVRQLCMNRPCSRPQGGVRCPNLCVQVFPPLGPGHSVPVAVPVPGRSRPTQGQVTGGAGYNEGSFLLVGELCPRVSSTTDLQFPCPEGQCGCEGKDWSLSGPICRVVVVSGWTWGTTRQVVEPHRGPSRSRRQGWVWTERPRPEGLVPPVPFETGVVGRCWCHSHLGVYPRGRNGGRGLVPDLRRGTSSGRDPRPLDPVVHLFHLQDRDDTR